MPMPSPSVGCGVRAEGGTLAQAGEPLIPYRARNYPGALTPGKPKAGKRTAGRRGLARNADGLMAANDALAETADERGEAILGAFV